MKGMEVDCSYCGETVERAPHKVERNENNFCSRDCYYAWKRDEWDAPHTKEKVEIECDNCGDIFEVIPSREDRARFCSKRCLQVGSTVEGEDHHNYSGGKTEFTCRNCGDTFERYPSNRDDKDKYCSKSCYREASKELFAGENNPVWRGGWEWYYGANWEEQRLKAIIRDQARCQRCGDTAADMDESPPVHHRKRLGWFREEYDDPEWWQKGNRLENLVTLCPSCHSYIEWHDADV